MNQIQEIPTGQIVFFAIVMLATALWLRQWWQKYKAELKEDSVKKRDSSSPPK